MLHFLGIGNFGLFISAHMTYIIRYTACLSHSLTTFQAGSIDCLCIKWMLFLFNRLTDPEQTGSIQELKSFLKICCLAHPNVKTMSWLEHAELAPLFNPCNGGRIWGGIKCKAKNTIIRVLHQKKKKTSLRGTRSLFLVRDSIMG